MNGIKWLAAALAGVFASVQLFASEIFVLPRKDDIGVYANQIRHLSETPIFKVTTQDRLLVVETGKEHYLVKNSNGQTGWIEMQLCARAPRGTSFGFQPIGIYAALEGGARPMYIGGDPVLPDDGPILLKRSFASELRINSDRDEMCRIVQ